MEEVVMVVGAVMLVMMFGGAGGGFVGVWISSMTQTDSSTEYQNN